MSPNLHSGETQTPEEVSERTKNVVDELERELGDDAKPVFASLVTALTGLGSRIGTKLQQANKEKKGLDLNTAGESVSAVKVPSPNLPDLGPIQKLIQQLLPSGSSPEITGVHKSMGQASKVRDPENLKRFEKRKDDQTRSRISADIASLGRSQVNINNVKGYIQGKL